MQTNRKHPDRGHRWHWVAIGLGANLGRRREMLAEAVVRIADHLLCSAVSPPVESAPEDGPEGSPAFMNAVLIGLTRLAPPDLLAILKLLERRAGRRPGPRNAPRPLDCDLLLYGSVASDAPELTLPHPRLHQRAFWLVPLAAVARDWTPTHDGEPTSSRSNDPTWRSWPDRARFTAAGIRVVEPPDAGQPV